MLLKTLTTHGNFTQSVLACKQIHSSMLSPPFSKPLQTSGFLTSLVFIKKKVSGKKLGGRRMSLQRFILGSVRFSSASFLAWVPEWRLR